jgi:hypothetical protein
MTAATKPLEPLVCQQLTCQRLIREGELTDRADRLVASWEAKADADRVERDGRYSKQAEPEWPLASGPGAPRLIDSVGICSGAPGPRRWYDGPDRKEEAWTNASSWTGMRRAVTSTTSSTRSASTSSPWRPVHPTSSC